MEQKKNPPLVSIVTVVYNSERFIEKTIQSIINQTYPSIEYIIVDGGSTDGTIEIIKKYDDYVNKWVSEKDNGLYDAMNKSLEMVNGDYIWFINSGDEIYNENIITEIFTQFDDLPDIIYGETEIIDFKGNSLGMRRHSTPGKLNWRNLRFGMKVCHQSFIVKKNQAEPYLLKYNYSSDFEWAIRTLKKAQYIFNSNLILSKFMDGGLSKKRLIPSLKERFHIMKQYYGLVPTVLNHFYLAFRLFFYYIKYGRI